MQNTSLAKLQEKSVNVPKELTLADLQKISENANKSGEFVVFNDFFIKNKAKTVEVMEPKPDRIVLAELSEAPYKFKNGRCCRLLERKR